MKNDAYYQMINDLENLCPFDKGSYARKEWLKDNIEESMAKACQLKTEPLPKRKVTKTVRGWVNVWDDHVSKVYPDKAQANKDYGYLNSTAAARIACVEVTGTYECEYEVEE